MRGQRKHCSKGATLTDYGILAGLLGAVAIGSVLYLGTETNEVFEAANAGVEAGAARGNGPGGGNNGNGNGNGGSDTCFEDTAGSDAIIAADLVNNCVDVTTGYDTLSLSGAASGAIVNVNSGDPSSTAVVSGPASGAVVNIAAARQGTVEMRMGASGATIVVAGRNLSDLGITRQNTSGRMTFVSLDSDGNPDSQFKLALHDALNEGTYGAGAYTIQFDDATITSSTLLAYATEMTFNNVNGYMTPQAETFEIRCVAPTDMPETPQWLARWYDGSDGDDTIVYTSGSARVSGGYGQDVLDLSMFAQADVSYVYEQFSGTVYVMLPDGHNLALPGWGWSGQDQFIVEEILFSDGTVVQSDVSALATGPVVRPDLPSCAPAIPAGVLGERIGGPSGPREVEEPMDG